VDEIHGMLRGGYPVAASAKKKSVARVAASPRRSTSRSKGYRLLAKIDQVASDVLWILVGSRNQADRAVRERRPKPH